jgi:hypothetical protein
LLAPGDTRLWSGARWRNPDGGFAASFICRNTTLGRCRVVWLLLQPGWFARHTRVFAPNPPGVGMRDDLHALVGCMCGCTCRAADFTAHRGVCLCTSLGTLPRPTPVRRGKVGKDLMRGWCVPVVCSRGKLPHTNLTLSFFAGPPLRLSSPPTSDLHDDVQPDAHRVLARGAARAAADDGQPEPRARCGCFLFSLSHLDLKRRTLEGRWKFDWRFVAFERGRCEFGWRVRVAHTLLSRK